MTISKVVIWDQIGAPGFPGPSTISHFATPSDCDILVDLTSRFCGMVPTKTESCKKNGDVGDGQNPNNFLTR